MSSALAEIYTLGSTRPRFSLLGSIGYGCWISRRYKRALTGTANGGRHKAMPCLAEEVLKAPVGQPAFQQLKGAAALYCQSPSLSRSLAARHIGAPLSPVC